MAAVGIARQLAAAAIVTSAAAVVATSVGAGIRGPYATDSLPRDFAAGAVVLGSAAALRWALLELAGPDPGPGPELAQ